MHRKSLTIAASIAGVMIAGAAGAQTTLYLGDTAQNYTLIGQGDYSPGLGSFTNEQGSESYDAGDNTTTATLSGAIAGATSADFASGSFAFVTTYTGAPIGTGGTQIESESSPANSNSFFYSYFDPSVNMTLYLTGTPGGNYTIPVVTNGAFDSPSFYLYFDPAMCTGIAGCDQNTVGLTPGATEYGPVDISFSLPSVPEPAAWAFMLLGVGLAGAGLRARRSRALAAA
jgi:hypothetical protein